MIRRTAPPGRTGRLCQGPNFADRGDRFLAHTFVSYARNDKSLVAPLVAAISHELEGAHTVVVVWTAGSVDSRWVRGKARDAAHQGQGRYDVGHDACEEALLALPGDGTLLVGLTAVIEDHDGQVSYWALAHRAEKPDFHSAAGFVLEIERASTW